MATQYGKETLDYLYDTVYAQELQRSNSPGRAREAAQQAVKDYYLNGGTLRLPEEPDEGDR